MGLSMIGISITGVRDRADFDSRLCGESALAAGGRLGEEFLRSHVILPAAALAAPYIAYVARLMRGSMVEVLNSPFILMARAKGVPRSLVILRHAMKPALMPLVSFLGPATAGIITGSIVIETIFGLPGIGRAFVDGALNRDYTLVLGVTILYGALIVGSESFGRSQLIRCSIRGCATDEHGSDANWPRAKIACPCERLQRPRAEASGTTLLRG